MMPFEDGKGYPDIVETLFERPGLTGDDNVRSEPAHIDTTSSFDSDPLSATQGEAVDQHGNMKPPSHLTPTLAGISLSGEDEGHEFGTKERSIDHPFLASGLSS